VSAYDDLLRDLLVERFQVHRTDRSEDCDEHRAFRGDLAGDGGDASRPRRAAAHPDTRRPDQTGGAR
jgi:hypothetical protein